MANEVDYTIVVRWMDAEKRWYIRVSRPDSQQAWCYAGEEMRGSSEDGTRALMLAVRAEIDSWLF